MEISELRMQARELSCAAFMSIFRFKGLPYNRQKANFSPGYFGCRMLKAKEGWK
jgi:hypothetical protein